MVGLLSGPMGLLLSLLTTLGLVMVFSSCLFVSLDMFMLSSRPACKVSILTFSLALNSFLWLGVAPCKFLRQEPY